MAQDVFGKAAMVLTADAAQMNKGLADGENRVASFVAKINSGFKTVGLGIKAGFVGLGLDLLKQFNFGGLKKEVDHIADEAKLAERLGVPIERFSNFMGRSRLDAQQTYSALQSAASLSARAASGRGTPGGGRAGQVFQQIGVKPDDLRGLSNIDATRVQAEAILKVRGAMEQTRLATRLWGAEGARVLNGFRGDINAADERLKRLGLTLSTEDVAAARQAQEAFKQTGQIVQGAFRQMAVAVSPVFAFINNAFLEWRELTSGVIRNVADAFKGFFDVVRAIFAELGEATGGYLEEVKEFWASFKTDIPLVKEITLDAFRAIGSVIGWLVDRFAELGAGFGDYVVVPIVSGLSSLLSSMASWTRTLDTGFVTPVENAFRRILTAAESIAELDPSGFMSASIQRARSVLDSAREIRGEIAGGLDSAASGLNSTLGVMRAANDELRNRTGTQANIDRFFDGVQNRMRQGVQQVAAELQGIDPLLQARAAQLTEKFKSPLEALKESLDQLGEVFEAGLIDSNVLGRAMQDALKQAESALHIGPQKFASASLAGSKEAATAIYTRNNDRPLDVQERIRAIQERQLALQEINTRNSADMVAALRNRSTIDWI